ncbi:MAG: hypothetical protein U0269_30570 [Polyangiales bacterium]
MALGGAGIAACGGAGVPDADEQEGASEADALTASVTPGTFKLYAEPHAQPNAFCGG